MVEKTIPLVSKESNSVTAPFSGATIEVRFDLDIDAYHSLPHVSSSRERDFNRSKELYYGRYVSGHIPPFSTANT